MRAGAQASVARGQAALAGGGRLPGQLLVARALAADLEERIARHCAVLAAAC